MAKCGITNISGGGGIGSDELSVTKDYVLSGKTYVGSDTNDEIGTGIMIDNKTTSDQNLNAGGSFIVKKGYHAQDFKVNANGLASQTSATAVPTRVMSGDTYWANGVKNTGTMTVNSILSFSAAAYSTTQILLQWQNPYAATGRPFSGVFINYSTGGYPGTGGTRIYTGYGNNATPGGISQAIVTMPSIGTTYYFSATAYASASPSDLWGSTLNAVAATTARGQQVITASGTFTVPAGVREIDVFVVGGGASGGSGSSSSDIAGNGGNAGKTATMKKYAVTPGQQFAVNIGAGGASSRSTENAGGTTTFGSILSAVGGEKRGVGVGGKGGSGGGTNRNTSYSANKQNFLATSGGADGADGGTAWRDGYEPVYGGTGQHTTTRAFGESGNTLYAGGGSGGGENLAGAAGGGGKGGGWRSEMAGAGAANTGGGGGGGPRDADYSWISSGGGGSGLCIVRWGY